MVADLKGVRIYYREYGQGNRAVFLFHGWAMTGDSWRRLAERFPVDQWRLIMPDLRGFGESAKPSAGYHINDYMRDALRLMRALGIRRVDVIGHSFGGTGALYLALRLPHLVRHLVLLSTIPGAQSPTIDPRIRQQFERIVGLVQRAQGPALATLLTRLWRQSFVVPPDPEDLNQQLLANRNADRHAILQTLHTILTTDISHFLPRLRVPTLLIRGEDDPLLRHSPDGLEHLARTTRILIPHVGHYPHLENPDAVWHHLSTFLGVETP
ncbi:MAG: alpha/beta hydrolase [Firmicutes bacterium]|nr:alpha/beta hydrolase [Bacillota bacterium]